MILQPERGMRNVNDAFYDYEAEQIALLNELFGDITLSREEERTLVWLTQGTPYGCAGWEKSTVMNVVQGNSSGSKSAGTAVLSGDTEEVTQAG